MLTFPTQDRDSAQKPAEVMCVHALVPVHGATQCAGGEGLSCGNLWHEVLAEIARSMWWLSPLFRRQSDRG